MKNFSHVLIASALVFVAQASFASETFQQGDLNIGNGALANATITLGGQKFQGGKADITVGSAGLFGDGYLTLSTNGARTQIKIPRRSYISGVNFMSYAKDSGQLYNIRGTITTNETLGQPVSQQSTCNFQATILQVETSVDSGTVDQQSGAPIMKTVNLNVPVCVWTAVKANTKSQIQYSDNGLCQGSHLEANQVVTDQTVYKLEFFDPQNPNTPIATFNGAQGATSYNKDLGSQSDCQ